MPYVGEGQGYVGALDTEREDLLHIPMDQAVQKAWPAALCCGPAKVFRRRHQPGNSIDPGEAAAPDWAAAAPVAERAGPNNKQWRIIGALNALSGRVTYRDAYIMGRERVGAFYHQLVATYPQARRLYVVQDNWSIHTHPDVLAIVASLPQVTPLWLPTYAPWLNPIEKLWRWLRAAVLTLHRLAGDWDALHARVRTFLDQFAAGSDELLHYVGLLGDGCLAAARRAA